MLCISKIGDYLKILTDHKLKEFVPIHFSEYLKSAKEKLYSKLSEEQNLRKVGKFLYIFLITSDKVEKYATIIQSNSSDNCVYCFNIMILNLLDPELQALNTKSMIKNKLKRNC